MIVFKNEHPIACDVDDTLVIHGVDLKAEEGSIAIFDPYMKEDVWVYPHLKHIRWLKKLKSRGYGITVWSHGGVLWAESVVLALGLEDIVDKVEAKPEKVIDDLSIENALGKTQYLPFKKGEENC